jgi:Ca2+-transporting ATPase
MILRWPAPLAVAQILWIHLICDGPSDIVLGFEPKEPGIMKEKPKSLKEPVLTHLGLSLIGVISITSTIAALLLFGYYFNIHGDAVEGRSLVFASFATNSMIYIFAYRSMRRPLYRMNRLSENKPLVWAVLGGLLLVLIAFIVPGIRHLLGIVPLHPEQWLIVAGIASILLISVEIGKRISNRIHAID